MSGHSKWAKIKHKKGTEDAKRGVVFSRLSKLISAAVREGGGVATPEGNPRLRSIVEKARSANMPKENISRAIEIALKHAETQEVFVLEGYGPGGVAIILEVASDNRTRVVAEIKTLFAKTGGGLATTGSVVFLFDRKIELTLTRTLAEDELLQCIDLGVENYGNAKDSNQTLLIISGNVQEKLASQLVVWGVGIEQEQNVWRPVNQVGCDQKHISQLETLLTLLENHDEVIRVYTNWVEDKR